MRLLVLIAFSLNCACAGKGAAEKNYASCASDSKKAITEITTVDELESIENTNPSATCERLTYFDDARLLLDKAARESDSTKAASLYLQAAEILDALVGFYPEEYSYYSLAAAAFAGGVGIELASFLGQMSGGDDFFSLGYEMFPGPSDDSYISTKNYLTLAVNLMDLKIEALGETSGKGDFLQVSLYRMAQTMVIANGFLVPVDSGGWDQEALDNVTVEDVDAIIDNMSAIVAQVDDPQLQEKFSAFSDSDQLTDAEKKELIKAQINK
ncbi:MAG: hypothetical protein R3B45_14955 [Bdellovibrionota bacterium]